LVISSFLPDFQRFFPAFRVLGCTFSINDYTSPENKRFDADGLPLVADSSIPAVLLSIKFHTTICRISPNFYIKVNFLMLVLLSVSTSTAKPTFS
jgi:hypothetical protein